MEMEAPFDRLLNTNINHKGLQRTANEFAEERRIYKEFCFRVRVRVDTNPNPNPKTAFF